MEENQQMVQPESQEVPQEEKMPDITLGDAMAGVISSPGDTFTEVKRSSKKNYWLVPLLIVIVLSLISSFLVMRDEELSSAIKDKQKTAMKEKFDEMVKKGEITREQADQQMEQSMKFMSGSMMMVFAMVGSFFGVLLIFFLKALVYWGGLKIFKGTAGYLDIMNVVGLSSLITAIQLVVGTVLAILMGKIMMNIGPVLLFSEEAVGKNIYTLLANFDLINIWSLVVVGIGLAKVSNVKTSSSMILVFGLWLVWVLLTSFGPFGMFAGR